MIEFLLHTKLGNVLVAAAALTGLFFAWLFQHDAKVEKRGEKKVVERSVKAGKKANAKNEDARRRAAEPGAFQRLLKDSCRDCGGVVPGLATPDRK